MQKPFTIGIIVFDDVLTSEVIGPAEVFGMASKQDWFKDSKIILIGVEPKSPILTEEGVQLTVDATIDDDLKLDVLLVPGANDVHKLLTNEKLNKFIQKQETSVEWLGSVCAGAFLLGNAGMLNGKKATTYTGGETDLQKQFPAIHVESNKPVVIDSRRITANQGLVSYRAAIVLLGKLTSFDHAKEIYTNLAIDRVGNWSEIESSN